MFKNDSKERNQDLNIRIDSASGKLSKLKFEFRT